MSERQKIEDRLRKKELELTALEEKARTARVYVQALRDILKMLSEGSKQSDDPEVSLRSGSAVAQARQLILDRGKPLHIDEILSGIGKDNTRESKASLTSSLAAYVRRCELFTRPAPNTFGLSELGHQTANDLPKEPPSNFGALGAPEPDDDIPF